MFFRPTPLHTTRTHPRPSRLLTKVPWDRPPKNKYFLKGPWRDTVLLSTRRDIMSSLLWKTEAVTGSDVRSFILPEHSWWRRGATSETVLGSLKRDILIFQKSVIRGGLSTVGTSHGTGTNLCVEDLTNSLFGFRKVKTPTVFISVRRTNTAPTTGVREV